jgi:hypothetical protein
VKNINKPRNTLEHSVGKIITVNIIRLNKIKFDIEEYKKKINIASLLYTHNIDLVRKLLCNENLLITDIFDHTPLYNFILFTKFKYIKIPTEIYIAYLKLFIDNEQNVLRMKSNKDRTPLHIGLYNSDKYSDYTIFNLLIDNQSNVLTMQDNKGNTPLHNALINVDYLTIEIIIRLVTKETLNITNNEGLTPIEIIVCNINPKNQQKYNVIKEHMESIASYTRDIVGRLQTKPDAILLSDRTEISSNSKRPAESAELHSISNISKKSKPSNGGNNKYKLICFHHCY